MELKSNEEDSDKESFSCLEKYLYPTLNKNKYMLIQLTIQKHKNVFQVDLKILIDNVKLGCPQLRLENFIPSLS